MEVGFREDRYNSEENMKSQEAIAEVFITALKGLPKKDREAVLAGIASDKSLAEDLLDLALIESRRDEPSRPFREFLAEKHQE